MVVGEIGYNRHEFLYELRQWEISAIIRGYHRRYHSFWEMARLCAYMSAHCMGAKNARPISEWLPFWWEKEQGDEELDDAEVERLRELIRKENEARKK